MAALDHSSGLGDVPADNAESVTASDANELAYISRGLYVGTGGDIAAVMAAGFSVTFANVPAGTLLPIRVKQVKSTGTTASNIVSIW